MLPDLKYAFRRLGKAPGFTAIAVLILALGIASNTSVFTVIDALLLRGLPVSHPEELVLLSTKMNDNPLDRFSYPAFDQFRTHAQSFTGVTAFTSAQRAMVISGSDRNDPIPVNTAGVSGDFFSVLGRRAFLGRTLTPIDDRPDAPRAVIVLSYAFWQRQFGANPDVLDKTVLIDNTQFSIVGVTAPGFSGVEVGNPTDLGFNPKNVLIAYLGFDQNATPAHRATLAKDAIAAVTALPGVRSSTFSTNGGTMLAGSGNVTMTPVSVEGYIPKNNERIMLYDASVGPRFFATMGMALAEGREFEFADAFPSAAPATPNAIQAIIINEAMARQYFGNEDPLGRQILIPDQETASASHLKQTPFKIIGAVKNTKHINLRKDNLPEIYLPAFAQLPTRPTPAGMALELRASESPLTLVPQLRTAIHAIDPKSGNINFITTLDDVVDRHVTQERMIAQTATFFSLFALLLASLGLYGVLAYNVAQRTREIGVRIALGAQPGNIISLVLHQGMGLTLIGCGAGTVAAMALAHLIASRLYGIPALDPLTFLSTAVVLLLVALIACWLPARRATKVDPMVALRAE